MIVLGLLQKPRGSRPVESGSHITQLLIEHTHDIAMHERSFIVVMLVAYMFQTKYYELQPGPLINPLVLFSHYAD